MAKIITPKIEQLCFDEVEAYVEAMESSRKIKRASQRFAPTKTALITLASLPENTWIEGKSFIDAECGIGQLLVPVAIIKHQLGHDDILSTIYGTDIIEENVKICQQRLLAICGLTESNSKQVEQNIVCTDSLTYDFKFNYQLISDKA